MKSGDLFLRCRMCGHRVRVTHAMVSRIGCHVCLVGVKRLVTVDVRWNKPARSDKWVRVLRYTLVRERAKPLSKSRP
jgi:hypothetical protein